MNSTMAKRPAVSKPNDESVLTELMVTVRMMIHSTTTDRGARIHAPEYPALVMIVTMAITVITATPTATTRTTAPDVASTTATGYTSHLGKALGADYAIRS